jgi:D-serine deaminase-like pyridoxal phosphate-dependent protein
VQTPLRAAEPGQPAALIDTPALILDLDAFERNLERMSEATTRAGLRLRPHAKSHKCPEIARRQIERGAIGICCQKVSEAEVFANGGITDILVTNEIVGARKLERLALLARTVRLGVLVDSAANVDALGQVAIAHRAQLDVYIEVDVGAGRCGVAPGFAAVALAQHIESFSGLRLAGLHCYHGLAQHLRGPAERSAAIALAARAAQDTRVALETAGHAVHVITGAGTGSFVHERDSGVFTELQPGSYIFMDRDYAENRLGAGDVQFEHALFVETSVMSVAAAGRAVVDAGLKASSVDSGLPLVWKRDGVRYARPSDEHGVVELSGNSQLTLGEHLRLVPGHCDPTVNLYDWLVGVRGDLVEALWPIAARGALL